MKKRVVLLVVIAGLSVAHGESVPQERLEARREFSELKFGIFVHWGLYASFAQGEWYLEQGGLDEAEYAKAANAFYPHAFDAREWVRAFKSAGAKYVVFTTRHHDGFSMFDSKATDYDIVDATPFRRDVVRELADACRDEGLKLGFYYSLMDWHRPDYPTGREKKARTSVAKGREDYGSYLAFMKSQLTELLTNYGDVLCIWFDGEWDHDPNDVNSKGLQVPTLDWRFEELYAHVHRLQPKCLILNNHHHAMRDGEDIQGFERDAPGENKAGLSPGQKVEREFPLETCDTMTKGAWGYQVGVTGYKSPAELRSLLKSTNDKGANLLLNVGPQPDGSLPGRAVEILSELGRESKIGATTRPMRGWRRTKSEDNGNENDMRNNLGDGGDVGMADPVSAMDGTKPVPLVPKTVNGKVELVPAEEVHVRKGVGNFLAKLKTGKPVTVAYLGGSITEMSGWRNMTTDWLRKAKPGAEVTEVHAAIGGTGSNFGVFRLGHDALAKDPDLIFVEFATNDSDEKAESIWRNFDGIVQQTWKKNPKTDIVFVYTITTRMMKEYEAGKMNHAASAMEHLADYYGIPSVCFGPRVAAEVTAGRLIMSLGEVPTAVPKETPDRDRLINEELKKKGQTLFAKDGVHPALPGHGFYLKSVVAAFEAMRELPPANHAAFVGKPFFNGSLAEANMVPIDESMLVGQGWTKLVADEPEQKLFGQRGGQFWRADRPGAKLAFRFRGTKCGVYDLLAPKGANVRITVDGKVTRESCPRFDSYCWYTRLAPLWVFDGEEGEHSVEIEVLEEQPDRSQVKREDVNTPKYDGTWFQPCQVMVVGDVVR